MADNLTAQSAAPATPAAGTSYRSLIDASGNEWFPGVAAYVTNSSTPWTFQLVNATTGLPVTVVGSVSVTGTFYQATQPVSAASLPLPSGASTAAKQPALGTAGTASADVITVQGIASMTALKVDGSAVTQPVSAAGNLTVVQATGTNLHAVVDSGTITTVSAVTAITNALPAGTNVIGHVVADTGSTTTVTGNVTVVQATGTSLHVVVDSATLGTVTVAGTVATTQSGTWNIGTVTAVTSISNALPAGTNVIGHIITDSGSTTAVTGNVTVVQGTGTNLHAVVDSGTITTVSTVTAVTTLGTITNVVHVDDNSGSLTVDGTVAATQSGTWTVQPGNTANTTPWLANPVDPAATTGNITAVDAATTTVTNAISQSITTGTPTAASSVSCTLSAHTGVVIQLSGTFTGTVAFERSADGGTTYLPHSLEEVSVGASTSSLALSDNRAYVLRGNCGEMTTLRVRCTAYTSGTLAVRFQPGFGPSQVIANQGPAQSSSYPWPVSLQVGTTVASLGHGTAAGGIRVELPTDGTGVVGLIAGSAAVGSMNRTVASSAALANVAASATNVTLLASNANRRGLSVYNDSSVAAYVKFGATASLTSFTVKIPANTLYEMPEPIYTGQIDCLSDSASGTLRTTEIS